VRRDFSGREPGFFLLDIAAERVHTTETRSALAGDDKTGSKEKP